MIYIVFLKVFTSRVRSLAQSVVGLHGRHAPFSLMQHNDCTVWHKKFKVAAWLAFKAVAVVSREVVTVGCQVGHEIASLASAEARLWHTKNPARNGRCTVKAAEGGAKLAHSWTMDTVWVVQQVA